MKFAKQNVASVKGWKISKSKKSFPNVIQQVKEVHKDHRRDGKIFFLNFIRIKHHSMKACLGSGGIAPRILNFGSRWR